MTTAAHIPVLLREVIEHLSPKNKGIYVDATFGAGGYTKAILDSTDCSVIAIDRDETAIARGKDLQKKYDKRLILHHACFGDLPNVVHFPVDGVVFDLGVSSPQIDDGDRGFSFMKDGPLDMRMGLGSMTAAQVVNTFSERALADIIFHYGEERLARRIAKRIVEIRNKDPFTRTKQLADLIAEVVPRSKDGHHPATRTFQALRIQVNEELDQIEKGLSGAFDRLKIGGKLVVVSFHSLEDRIVKNFMNQRSGKGQTTSRHQPLLDGDQHRCLEVLTKKPVAPSESECDQNPRARSAKLRVAQKTAEWSAAA